MGKRVLIFLTIPLILGVCAGWYFFARESRFMGTSTLKAIPVEAPWFVRIRKTGDFASKTSKSSSWKSMLKIRSISEFYGDFAFLDSLIRQNSGLESILRNKEMIVVPVDSARIYLLQIGSVSEKNSINSFIRNYFLSKKVVSVILDYKEASLQRYEWTENGRNKRMVITFYRGLLMLCSEASNLRLAIDQMDKPSVLDDRDFQLVNRNLTENIDVNIFINHKTFPGYISGFFPDSLSGSILRFNYAKWTEVDLVQKENQLLISGFTVPDTTLSCYLNIFKHQIPRNEGISSYMPATATFFVSQNLSLPKQYLADYGNYLQHIGKSDNYQSKISLLSQELKVDIGKYLNENWTGEVAEVFTNFNLEEFSDNRFLLLKIKQATNDPLLTAIRKWNANNKKSQRTRELNENERNGIWELPFTSRNFGALVGEPGFGSVETSWVTSGNGFILMGSTPGSLKRYLNLLQRHETLAEDPSYLKFISGLARTSSFYTWCKPGQFLPFFEHFIKTSHYQLIKSEGEGLNKIEDLAWQWGFENGMVYNTSCIKMNPSAIQNMLPFWRYPLAAKIGSVPVFISRSSKAMANDLIFQDVENNLVDLDKEGTERWKIQLESNVLGKIKVIDYHKNGDHQLLFNTREAIHLLDNSGAEVRNFPIRLRSAATNEVSVLDYDGKKDYRFLVACADRKVYNFEKSGKLTTGWITKSTQDIVEFPVHHFRVGSRDYLVFFDHNHTYILDRFGNERVRLKEEFVHSRNDISLIVDKRGVSSMVTTDDRGKIRMIGFDGSGKKMNAGNFSSAHFFLPLVRTSDQGSDFLFLDKKNLSLSDYSGKIVFTHSLAVQPDQTPVQVVFGNKKLIEIHSISENKTILIKNDGSIFDVVVPESCSLLTVGSFDEKTGVQNILTSSADGFLSSFQMIQP